MQTRPVVCGLGGGAEGLSSGLAAAELVPHVHTHPMDCMQTAVFEHTPSHQDSSFAQASRHVSETFEFGLSPALCSTAIRGA
jgi:hypothetical protein